MWHTEAQRYSIALSQTFKKAEAAYRKERGLNPSFPWSDWGDRPRACAIWTPKELTALGDVLVGMTMTNNGQKLGIAHLCELAWNHGRSVNGVYEKCRAVYGKQFWTLFNGKEFN